MAAEAATALLAENLVRKTRFHGPVSRQRPGVEKSRNLSKKTRFHQSVTLRRRSLRHCDGVFVNNLDSR
jgi:hypothetical protein